MKRPIRKWIFLENNIVFWLLKGWNTCTLALQTHVCQSSVQRFYLKCLPHVEVSIGGRPTKILEDMRKHA